MRLATVRWTRRGLELALVGLVLVGVGSFLIARVVPATGRQSLIVGGASMEPTIPLGSVAIVQPVPMSSLRLDDIVSLQAPTATALVTHRIARIVQRPDGVWLEMKGDANADPDPVLVPATAVVGRVVAVIPYAGRVLSVLARPAGLLAFFGAAGVLFVAIWWLDSIELEARRAPSRGRAPTSMAHRLG